MRKIIIWLGLMLLAAQTGYAAPCYGSKMPQKKEVFGGLQYHGVFKRYLEDDYGKLRSAQHFFLLSYGVYHWLSLDLKGGGGNAKQHPIASGEIDYSYNFAGGYGFRLKLYEKEKIKIVFGFQHISVHPKSISRAGIKQRAVLDDWQTSILVSQDFKRFTPYLGIKGSRLDYIHWQGEYRKRKMSDLTKDIGLFCGFDLPIREKVWSNIEFQFLDGNALSCSLNFQF